MHRPFQASSRLAAMLPLLLAGCNLVDAQSPPPLRGFTSGSMTFLERTSGGSTARIGLDQRWGGAIAEVSLDGENFVNAFDPGRLVQLSLYDGFGQGGDLCAGCTGAWPWNPVQGGDRHRHGSPVLQRRVSDSTLYVMSRPLHWFPDDKGGGPHRAVATDMLYETWVSVVPEHPRAFHVRYRATHLGADTHGAHVQEVPAVYANRHYDTFVSYMGQAPWTGGALTRTPLLSLQTPAWAATQYYIPERWASFVNAAGEGLTVFVPGAYPYALGYSARGDPGPPGSTGFDTNYFYPRSYFGVAPREVIEVDVYLIVGPVEEARLTVYALKDRPVADVSIPIVSIAAPAPGQALSGTLVVAGSAIDNAAVQRVEVLVDGAVAGTARYGLAAPRAPDGGLPDVGYEFALDTRTFANGAHAITVRATDTAGRTNEARVPVTFRN